MAGPSPAGPIQIVAGGVSRTEGRRSKSEYIFTDWKAVRECMGKEDNTINKIIIINKRSVIIFNINDQYVMDRWFGRINIVIVFIESIETVNIKIVINKYIYAINVNNNNNTLLSVNKCSVVNIREMYSANPTLFGCSNIKLPYTSHPLESNIILEYHNRFSKGCNNKCYINDLIKCIEYAWYPTLDRYNIMSKYKCIENYRTVDWYNDGCQKEVNEMHDPNILNCRQSISKPFGAIVKNFGKLRAKTVLVRIYVVDPLSVTEAYYRS